jgi:hypothetical protein
LLLKASKTIEGLLPDGWREKPEERGAKQPVKRLSSSDLFLSTLLIPVA